MATNMTGKEDLIHVFTVGIDTAIKQAIGNVFDKAIEQAVKDANARRDEVVSAAALKLSSWYNINDMGTHLTITIDKKAVLN